MTKRQGLWASLIIIGLVLLPGCESSMGTWQAYPGEKLPDEETALIKRGSDLDYWRIDGKKVLDEFNYRLGPIVPAPLSFSWVRRAARVLPGEHEISTGYPTNSITFEAEAGRVYTFFGKQVGEGHLVAEEWFFFPSLGLRREGHCYVWMKDESGTVIAGEKPPPD